MCIVSKVIPKKDSCVEGLSTLSMARGTPRGWQMLCMDDRLAWQIAVEGGYNVRKSSK